MTKKELVSHNPSEPSSEEIERCIDSAVGKYQKGYFNSITGPAWVGRRRYVFNYIAHYIKLNNELPTGIHYVQKTKGNAWPGVIGKGGFVDFDLTIK